MRSHAKASTAGSTQRQAGRLGRFFRGADATRGVSRDTEGSGAPKIASRALALLIVLFTLALGSTSASAAAPTIPTTTVSAVTTKAAVLEADINPEGEATTYHFEYGLADCTSNPCTSIPVPNENVGSGSSAVRIQKEVQGLDPGTIYHFRAVATNGSGPTAGPDRTFTTYAPVPATACPNQAFRVGFAASLSDCRGYEMVSPIEKNGGDIKTLCNINCARTAFNQSSLDGNKITYSSYRAFGDAASGSYSVQYLATRGADGWSTHGISAPRRTGLNPFLAAYEDLEIVFKDFSDDLSTAWLYDASLEPLAPDALEASANIYQRDNASDGYQTVTRDELASSVKLGSEPQMQGHSSNGEHVFFIARTALTVDGASGENFQLYDFSGGKLHLVSVLPDGTASPYMSWAGSWSGTPYGVTHGLHTLEHAVSEDGSRVFWSASPATAFNSPAEIFLRENPAEQESTRLHGSATGTGDLTVASDEVTNVSTTTGAFEVGQEVSAPGIPTGTTIAAVAPGLLTLSASATESIGGVQLSATSGCTEPARACTTDIGFGRFWTAASDGSKMLFDSFGDLKVFEVETEAIVPVAGELVGVLGASDDLSYIYFVSKESLAAGATAGEPNLYLDHEGTKTHVATLSSFDTAEAGLNIGYNIVAPEPLKKSTRVTADGRHIAFQSTRSLTGYDNAAANNGEPAVEVYTYDADAGQLTCASCNPSGARPVAAPLLEPFTVGVHYPYTNNGGPLRVWTAAWLTTAENSLHTPHALSEDGSRLFFNSFDALVPQDTNGVQDVYQWEAQGSGTCKRAGGCISMISTGQSPVKSEFVDATPDGESVFFETRSSIDSDDPGLVDIYVARVYGGYPPPPAPPTPCIGDACQIVPPAPNDPTPASASFRGDGDPATRKPRRSCRASSRHVGKERRQVEHKRAKRCKRTNRGTGR